MLPQEFLNVPYSAHFLFNIYIYIYIINNLAAGLSSIAKLFVDDTSLFSVVHNANTTTKELNNALIKVSNYTYQWKMSFNPDLSKQAQKVIFSRNLNNDYHPPLAFNNNNVSSCF